MPPPEPPDCSKCDRPAVGARFLSYVGSNGVGKHAWVAEFVCLEHSDGEKLPLMAANLNQWKMISRTEKGIYGIRKLTESEQNVNAIRYHDRTRGVRVRR